MKKLKYIGILFLLILFSCVDDESRYGDLFPTSGDSGLHWLV